MEQKYRITMLLEDGRQDSYVTEKPNYASLERSLADGQIKSFIVSLV